MKLPKLLIIVIVIFCEICDIPCSYIYHPGALHYIHSTGQIYTLTWAVKLKSSSLNITNEAERMGLINLGAINQLENYFLFAHPTYSYFLEANVNNTDLIFNEYKLRTEYLFSLHPNIIWYKQEVMRHRSKRVYDFRKEIKDPYFHQQWHLVNDQPNGYDLNVTGLWERNITGKGITVAVIDDGLEWTNKDLINNYNQKGSWDLNENDMDPMPTLDGGRNEHGTRCAGEIASQRNDFCGVGVAYDSKISGIKILDGKVTDSMEASAFIMKLETNDIYSCSWGPADDGETIDGPHHLTSVAMEYGVSNGRNGYGAIYVVSSGNGGLKSDNCNYDGYASSVYTITIGAVNEFGKVPFYAEECAAMLAVALSSGGSEERNIVTTDWTEMNSTGCTTEHSGTSAAAPLAAAVVALMLQVRSCLTWRDVQYLIILTSIQIHAKFADWQRNAAGLFHSNFYGFGLISAWRLVSASKSWPSVPFMSTFSSGSLSEEENIKLYPDFSIFKYNLTEEIIKSYFIWTLETVRVKISIKHPQRGRLELRLRSCSGTLSVLTKPRINDKLSDGLNKWLFTTVSFWGEKPVGEWTLFVTDHGQKDAVKGMILDWELIIYGTPMTTFEFNSRLKLAREAGENNVLDDENYSLPCRPPPMHLGVEVALSNKILQVLCFSGGFLFLLAVFETLEYIFCYGEEKRKFYDETLTRCGKISRQTGRNSLGSLESTPLMTESENDGITYLEMSNHNVEEYRGCDLMEDDMNVTDGMPDGITGDILSKPRNGR